MLLHNFLGAILMNFAFNSYVHGFIVYRNVIVFVCCSYIHNLAKFTIFVVFKIVPWDFFIKGM